MRTANLRSERMYRMLAVLGLAWGGGATAGQDWPPFPTGTPPWSFRPRNRRVVPDRAASKSWSIFRTRFAGRSRTHS